MTHEEIILAVNSGRRAADVARESGLPISVVHRIAHGWGGSTRPSLKTLCERCGGETEFRGGIYPLCGACRQQQSAERATASCAVRKAVNIGMLKPVKTCRCVDCGAPAADYDHRDYSRPLAVEPVCRSCNIRRGIAA